MKVFDGSKATNNNSRNCHEVGTTWFRFEAPINQLFLSIISRSNRIGCQVRMRYLNSQIFARTF